MAPKKLFFISAVFLLSLQYSFGQKTELYFNSYSGLFSFAGNGATSHSVIINYPFLDRPYLYTINPYGNTTAFSYALEIQGERITQKQNIYGLGIGFEELTSRVRIDKVTVSSDPAYLQYSVNGNTKLKNTFVTLNPFIGHRYTVRKIWFDFLAGVDFAVCLQSKELGYAPITSQDHVFVQNDLAKPTIDFRPRIQIKTQIHKFGLMAGYSLGLTNYQTKNNPKAFSRFVRIGLSYQLK